MTETAVTFDGPGLPDDAVRQPEDAPRPEPVIPAAPDDDNDGSAYDLLARRVRGRTAREPVTLPVPDMPGCDVTYAVDFEWETLQAWRKANTDPETGVPDAMRVAQACLVTQCREIRFNGRTVRRAGQPLTFVSDDLQGLVEAMSAPQAVRRLYANDAHVILTGDAVVAAAGYGDRLTKEARDPSQTSSGP